MTKKGEKTAPRAPGHGGILPGQRYNKLVSVAYIGKCAKGYKLWKFLCDCGQETIAYAGNVKKGNTTSCGCMSSQLYHTHELSKTRIYYIWQAMKARCSNPNIENYKHYGAKSITVCEEWLDKESGFINFYNWALVNGYEDHLTIERISVFGNYCPENCKWGTNKEQANNTTRTKWLEDHITGEIIPATEFMRRYELAVEESTFYKRLKSGQDVVTAAFTPPKVITRYGEYDTKRNKHLGLSNV